MHTVITFVKNGGFWGGKKWVFRGAKKWGVQGAKIMWVSRGQKMGVRGTKQWGVFEGQKIGGPASYIPFIDNFF